VTTLEQTLRFLNGASPEDAQKVHQVLSFFQRGRDREVLPDATTL
jgi:hypothetical protein